MTFPWGERIWLVGPSGAGKSTFARALQARLQVPLIELDRMFWLPDWRRADVSTFESAVLTAAAADRWIIDGQYDIAHHLLRERADMVIWLDTAAGTVFPRLVRRTVRRLTTREELWNGNRERLLGALQLLGWSAREFRRVRVCNEHLLNFLQERQTCCLRVRTREDLRTLLAALET
ncbi:AAA family ATPase [Nonomuraea sp. NPDC050227]|uniref:AAA family ATPase n=1 Tax=Nonomuraea sp. NPDC050227 TaxID=3364360 RepID=UPI0037B90E6D